MKDVLLHIAIILLNTSYPVNSDLTVNQLVGLRVRFRHPSDILEYRTLRGYKNKIC